MEEQIGTKDLAIGYLNIYKDRKNATAKEDIEVKYEAAKKLLKELENLYYKDGTSPLTDEEYDEIKTDVLSFEGKQEYDFVPGEDLNGEDTFKHPTKVLSLSKVNDESLLEKEIKKLLPCIIEPKYDGMTGMGYYIGDNQEYQNDIINNCSEGCVFATRGNGEVGINITSAINKIGKFNKQALKFINKPIRFEIFMRKSVLAKINKERIEEGLDLFKNTRNATAGIIRSEDEDLLNKLDFVAYNIYDDNMSDSEQLNTLYRNKIYVPDPKVCMKVNTEEDIPKAMEFIKNFDREKLDYDIDGLVIKANYKNSLEKCGGCVEHHPKNAFAWKFKTESKWTRMKQIKYQVGRTGKITPVVIVDPVDLYGTTVTKATLHNADKVKELGLTQGCEIRITKANEIIPYVLECKSEDNAKPIKEIQTCPVCGSTLKMINGTQYCVNNSCKNKLLFLINHLARKDCLNIDGLAESTIEKLIDNGTIKVFTDIFNITKDDLMTLEGFKIRKASKLANNIANSTKNVSLEKFIYAAGIDNVGKRASRVIANEVLTFAEFVIDINNGCPRIRNIKSIGDKIANNLITNRDRFGKLFRYINPLDSVKVSQDTNKEKIHFCVTGTLDRFTRDEYVYSILSLYDNTQYDSSITKNTDYLVIGKKAGGNKLAKAKKYNVNIVTPNDFITILDRNK